MSSSYLLLDKKKVNCKIGANGIGIKSSEKVTLLRLKGFSHWKKFFLGQIE